MTAWMISKYHIWRVAVSGASVNDWIADYGTADDSMADADLFHGSPFVGKNAAEWRRASAISYARGDDAGAHPIRRRRQPRQLRHVVDVLARAARQPQGRHVARVAHRRALPDDPVRTVDVFHYWIDFIAQHFQ